jgi:hypothetical protein
MKAKLFIVLAAVAMLFIGCTKEKEPGKNTVTYDGVTYEVTPTVQLDDYDPNYAYLSAISGKVMFGVPLFEGATQKTYDLSEEYPCEFDLFIGNNIEEDWDILFIDYGCWSINGEDYEHPFLSGSLETKLTDNTYSFVMDTKLGNGKKLAINVEWTSDWFTNH